MKSVLLPELIGDDDSQEPIQVLVVDDDNMQRQLERDILSSNDIVVTEASNGNEALELIRHHEFDVALIDKRMPGMDGSEIVWRIRNELGIPFLPILMVSGSHSMDDMSRCLSLGANDYIRKPYSGAELIARVQSAANSKRLTDQLDSAESLLFALARMVEAKDEGTGDHCNRLAHMAVAFGKELGLAESDLLALRRGGVLHDIGKLAIPDSILIKKDTLDKDEWDLMRQHTVIGVKLCQNLRSMSKVLPIILYHHERWDGTGYPHGLMGEETPYLARVFQFVDIYDALVSKRPYKEPFPHEQVISILEDEIANGWRDPELGAAFLDMLRHSTHLLQVPEDEQTDLGDEIFSTIVNAGLTTQMQQGSWQPFLAAEGGNRIKNKAGGRI